MSTNTKKQQYGWDSMKKEFDERLKKAVPLDLKGFVGLVDSKGECPFCKVKKVLVFDRISRVAYCSDCIPVTGYQYTAIEFHNMWQLARDLLFHTNEVIMELKYPDVDFSSITPSKMKAYLMNRGWNYISFKTAPGTPKNTNVWRFTKKRGVSEIDIMVPARRDLEDYHRATEIVIEVVAAVENRSRLEVYRDFSR